MIDSKSGIIGLAIGDAMGVPLEFLKREDLINNPVTVMLGEQSHHMPKGSWSDDTSLNLALIDSINNKNDIDLFDIGQNFIAWGEKGKYTPTGQMFGIGRTTLRSIARLEEGKLNPEECGGNTESDNGNGSLMRILPVAYYCFSKNYNDKEIYETIKKVSSITHAHEISVMGCYIYVKFALELLSGKNIKQAYKSIRKINYEYFSEGCQNVYKRLIKNDIAKYKMDDISTSGYVLHTLEATIWILLNTDTFNRSIVAAINMGGDSDTTGACVGGLSGIYYGLENINKEWIKDLQKYDYIEEMCNRFNEVLNSNE